MGNSLTLVLVNLVTYRRQTLELNKIEFNHREEEISLLTVKTPSVSSTEMISVNGIITRYFPEYEEVSSSNVGHVGKSDFETHPGCLLDLHKFSRSKYNVDQRAPHFIKTPPALLPRPLCTEPKQFIETPREKFERTKFGNVFL